MSQPIHPSADDLAREEALAYVAQQDKAKGENFREFWAAMAPHGTRARDVFGRDVELPESMPLEFDATANALKDSKDPEDTKRLVGILFGHDALDHWTSQRCTVDQFGVLLMWGSANAAKPDSMSLTEALTAYLEQKRRATERATQSAEQPAEDTPADVQEAEGKARASAKRTPSGAASSSTGRSSKRTSRASTA